MRREAFGLGIVGAIVVSCSFPDPAIVGAPGDGGSSSSSGGASSSSSGSSGDGGGLVDANACPDRCGDCDKDGALAKSGECPNGVDCDDFDPRAHPGADFSDAAPTTTTAGNWNCDDHVEKRWPGNVTCALVGGQCTGEGFTGAQPECGQEGDWIQCAEVTVGVCSQKDNPVKKKQQCR